MLKFELQELYVSYGDWHPILKSDKDLIANKYADSDIINGHDANALYGALYFLTKYNDDLLLLYGYTIDDILNGAAICNNQLNLNNFEGYALNERLTLNALYLNQYNQVMGSVYDNKTDIFLHFLMA